ncbi:S8 family serine peptidase [Pantoea ananatis]|uniref:S8 family serine peptidase n=1 Tax=Pantoea ananas TaxID=553 RepID=UPI0039B8F641
MAVIDTGGYDFISDASWHGTHVAGTIAMRTNNGIGMAGIAPDAKILPAAAPPPISPIHRGLGRNPAEVINMSLGGGGACGRPIRRPVQRPASPAVAPTIPTSAIHPVRARRRRVRRSRRGRRPSPA